MSQNFKKASELLHSKNNIDVTDKLKENFTRLNKLYKKIKDEFSWLKHLFWECRNMLL